VKEREEGKCIRMTIRQTYQINGKIVKEKVGKEIKE
jgi:hypothetical protein